MLSPFLCNFFIEYMWLPLAVSTTLALPYCCSKRKTSKKKKEQTRRNSKEKRGKRRSTAKGDNQRGKTRTASTARAKTVVFRERSINHVDKKRAHTSSDNNIEDSNFASTECESSTAFSPMPSEAITENIDDQKSRTKKCYDLNNKRKNAAPKAVDFKVPVKKDEKAETHNPQYQTLAALTYEDVFGEAKNKAGKPAIKAPKKIEPVDQAKKREYETLAGLVNDEQFQQKDASLKEMQNKAPSKVEPKDSEDPKQATLAGLVDDELLPKKDDKELQKETGTTKDKPMEKSVELYN